MIQIDTNMSFIIKLTDRTAAVNDMCCEIVGMLASSARGRRFDPKSGQTICYDIDTITQPSVRLCSREHKWTEGYVMVSSYNIEMCCFSSVTVVSVS